MIKLKLSTSTPRIEASDSPSNRGNVVAIETTGTRSTKTEGITRNPFSHRAHDKPQQALETLLRPTDPKVGSSNLSGRAEKAPRRRGFKSPLTRRPPPALVLAHAFSSSSTRHLTCAESRTG